MNTREQIDRILSESSSKKLDVIIQMDSEMGYRQYLTRTSRAIAERRSIISARALQPPAQIDLHEKRKKSGRLSARHKKEFARLLPTSSAASAMGVTGIKSIQGQSKVALSDLLGSEWFQRAVLSAAKGKDREAPDRLVRAFCFLVAYQFLLRGMICTSLIKKSRLLRQFSRIGV